MRKIRTTTTCRTSSRATSRRRRATSSRRCVGDAAQSDADRSARVIVGRIVRFVSVRDSRQCIASIRASSGQPEKDSARLPPRNESRRVCRVRVAVTLALTAASCQYSPQRASTNAPSPTSLRVNGLARSLLLKPCCACSLLLYIAAVTMSASSFHKVRRSLRQDALCGRDQDTRPLSPPPQ